MNRRCPTCRSILPWMLSALLLALADPVLANKFETIGSGVQGSSQIKTAYLQIIAYVVGALFLIAGVLAILLKDKNALSLNYTMWKASALIFFTLSIGAIAVAVLIR